MQNTLFELLICPKCSTAFEYLGEEGSSRHSPFIRCGSGHTYPVIGGIPRFVPSQNYADSFGYQWEKFCRVQLDSYNGSSFSEERFRTITEWTETDLRGKLVLDVGCGAGRFAELAVKKFGANLVACDLSKAIEVCRDNLATDAPLLCQASIYEMPLKEGAFDFVYCIGVIQHTPDPLGAIRALSRLVKPGGQIGLWIYELNWKSFVGSIGFKYALRPWISRLSRETQVKFCQMLVDVFFPIVTAAKSWGILGKIIMRLLPVPSAYLQSVNLSLEDLRTWVFLDTFDMYTPAYDYPQRYGKVARLLAELGFDNIRRHPHGAISVTARRKI